MDHPSPEPRPAASPEQPHFLQALMPHAPRLVTALIGTLLVTEAILALVVIFSRMSAFQQFVCVVLIVVLPAAVLALAVSSLARLARRPADAGPAKLQPSIGTGSWNARSTGGGTELSNLWIDQPEVHDLLVIVEQLEEMSLRARWMPLNTVRGLDEEQFTYLLVKLRATAQALSSRREQPSPRGLLDDGAPIFSEEEIARIQEEMRGTRAAREPVEESLPPIDIPVPVEETDPRESTPAPEGEIDEEIEYVRDPAGVAEILPAAEPEAAELEPEPAPGQGDSVMVETPEAQPETVLILSVTEAREALREGDAAKAVHGLKNLLMDDSENAEAAELLGIAYERSGDLDSALEAMRVAVLTDPNRASSHYNYAVLLSKADRLMDAHRQVEVALRLNPDYTSAREFQRLLQSRIVTEQRVQGHAIVNAPESAGVR